MLAQAGVYTVATQEKAEVSQIPLGTSPDGVLDNSWFAGIAIGYFQPTQPTDPPARGIFFWNDTTQIFIWMGNRWAAIA